jgi:ATP-dependent RNA helicase DeaD
VKEERRSLDGGATGAGADRGSRSNGKFTRLFINLGSVDDFTRGDMLRYLCDTSGVRGNKIGRIDLKGVYSFFEVENDVVEQFQQVFKKAEYNGRSVRIEMSQDGDKRPRSGGPGGSGSGRPREEGAKRWERSGSGERSGGSGRAKPAYKKRY